VKSDAIASLAKAPFKEFSQIASSLSTQQSLAGEPLSEFTTSLIDAILKQESGEIYYSDVINIIKDAHITNEDQTPHFVNQGTWRATFVDDAGLLDTVRQKWHKERGVEPAVPALQEPASTEPLVPLQVLQLAQKKFASKSVAQDFISKLGSKLECELTSEEFGSYFEASVTKHNDFEEPSTRTFIIRVLSSEKRPDNFVTAELSSEFRRKTSFGILNASLYVASV